MTKLIYPPQNKNEIFVKPVRPKNKMTISKKVAGKAYDAICLLEKMEKFLKKIEWQEDGLTHTCISCSYSLTGYGHSDECELNNLIKEYKNLTK